jgi:glycosyltransferase involved in cell wall biosynthesis
MRILLISYYFPPYNAVGALRTGKTVKYLAALGHDLRVVTAAEPPGLDASLPVEIPESQVVRVRWATADRLVARLLARRRSAAGVGNLTLTGATNALISRAGAIFRTLAHFPDETAPGLLSAYRAASALVRAWRPDVIVASASPVTTLLLAHLLGRRFGIPWVGELRDLWTENHAYPYPAIRRYLEAALERRVLHSAAGLVTVSEPLARRLSIRGRPTRVVLNGFDPADHPVDAQPGRSPMLRIVYTGHVFGARQDATPLVEAVQLLGERSPNVEVVFYGRFLGIALQKAMHRAAELGVAGSFRIEQPVPHREALRIQRQADVLLLLTWNDPANPGVYTGKLFEYIGARRPILAVGRGGTVADALVRERALGACLTDARAIADQLARWLDQKCAAGVIPSVPADNTVDLTREAQTRELAGFLSECIASSASHADSASLTR